MALHAACVACLAQGLPGQAAEPVMLLVELRWVVLSTPGAAGLSSAGQPRGGASLGTQAAGDGIEPLGPALRVLAGEALSWSLGRETAELPVTWAWPQVAGVPVQVPVPLRQGQERRWRLDAQAHWPKPSGPVLLQLRWSTEGDGDPGERLATTLRVPLGRWTTVALHNEGAAALPANRGELRSSAARPQRTRELQVRVSPVLE